jgi:hypothetical protein
VHLIKEVSDLRAKAAEENLAAQKAKDEAARGGEDLLVKAAETRTRVLQMKQDNLMVGLALCYPLIVSMHARTRPIVCRLIHCF